MTSLEPAPASGRSRLQLEEVVRTLRASDAFNRRQRPAALVNALAREVSELSSAVDAGSISDVSGELGDVLFNVMALIEAYRERGDLSLDVVDRSAAGRMVDGHPHVFAKAPPPTRAQAIVLWEAAKRAAARRRRASLAVSWVSGLSPLAAGLDAADVPRLARRCAAALGLGRRARVSTIGPRRAPPVACIARKGGAILDLVEGGDQILFLGWVRGSVPARVTRALRTVLGSTAEITIRQEHRGGRD